MLEREKELERLLRQAAVGAAPTEEGWAAIVARSRRHSPDRRRRTYLSVVAAVAASVVLLAFAITSRGRTDQTIYTGTTTPSDGATSPDTRRGADSGVPAVPSDPQGPFPDAPVQPLLGAKTGLTLVVHDGESGFDAIDLETGAARHLPTTEPARTGSTSSGFVVVAPGRIAELVADQGRIDWLVLPSDLSGPPDASNAVPTAVQMNGGLDFGGNPTQQGSDCPSYGLRAVGVLVGATIEKDATGACARLHISSQGTLGAPPAPQSPRDYAIRDITGATPALVLVSPGTRKALIGDGRFRTQLVDLETGAVIDTHTEPGGSPGVFPEADRFWSPDSRYVFEFQRTSTPEQHAQLVAAQASVMKDRNAAPYTDLFGTHIDPHPARLTMLDTHTGVWSMTTLPLAGTSRFVTMIPSATGPNLDPRGAEPCPAGRAIPAGTSTVTITDTVCLIPKP